MRQITELRRLVSRERVCSQVHPRAQEINAVPNEIDQRSADISAIDPVASMGAIDNQKLGAVAGKVRELLKQVIAEIT
jgi:hypothetical protein